MTIISKFKIIKVKGKVEGVNGEIFLDTCASVNAITRAALEKYNINKPALGTIKETIYQAYSNSTMQSEIQELEITIGNHTFREHFRVVEKDDLFDVLIGVDSLKKNRFDINLVTDKLYYIDEKNTYHELANLEYDIPFRQLDDTNQEEEEKPQSLLCTITTSKTEETANNNLENERNFKNETIIELPSNTHKQEETPTIYVKTMSRGRERNTSADTISRIPIEVYNNIHNNGDIRYNGNTINKFEKPCNKNETIQVESTKYYKRNDRTKKIMNCDFYWESIRPPELSVNIEGRNNLENKEEHWLRREQTKRKKSDIKLIDQQR